MNSQNLLLTGDDELLLGKSKQSSERGSLGFPSKGNSGPVPTQELLRALPYPLYAVLEPQLPPDGFLLLEELLQGLRERRRRGDLRADSTRLELGVQQLTARPRTRAAGGARPTKGMRLVEKYQQEQPSLDTEAVSVSSSVSGARKQPRNRAEGQPSPAGPALPCSAHPKPSTSCRTGERLVWAGRSRCDRGLRPPRCCGRRSVS